MNGKGGVGNSLRYEPSHHLSRGWGKPKESTVRIAFAPCGIRLQHLQNTSHRWYPFVVVEKLVFLFRISDTQAQTSAHRQAELTEASLFYSNSSSRCSLHTIRLVLSASFCSHHSPVILEIQNIFTWKSYLNKQGIISQCNLPIYMLHKSVLAITVVANYGLLTRGIYRNCSPIMPCR